MGRKVGGCCAPFGGGAGFPSNTMSAGSRPTSVPSGICIHPAVWANRHGLKMGALCLFLGVRWERLGESVGYPRNTIWPGSRSTSAPSGILIHPTVAHNTQTLQDRQTDNGPIAQGKPFYKRSPKKTNRIFTLQLTKLMYPTTVLSMAAISHCSIFPG